MPRPRNSLVVLIFLLGLGACTAPATTETPPQTKLAAQPDPASDPVLEETSVTNPAPETATPKPPAMTSSGLLGLEPADVQDLLGPVSLKRWEGEVQMMQFTNDHCVIDIYFYESAPGEAFQASYLTARTKSGTEIEADICLASLLPDKSGPGR